MSGQHHFEKTQFSRKSRDGQDADFYLHEWETSEYESDVPVESLEGKIIARMPDLGESKKNGLLPPYQLSVRKFTNRIYYGLVFCFRIPEQAIRSFSSKFVFKRGFVSRLIAVSLILLLVGGGFWIHKNNQKKQKLAKQTVVQNVEPTEQVAKPEKSAQTTPKPVTSAQPAEKPVTPVKPATSAQPAEKPAAPVKPATPPAKPVEKSVANAAEKPADKAAVSVIVPKADEKKNSDSPWERPSTDNYSPWTMNSPERKQSNALTSGTEQASVTANPVPAVNSPAPMTSSINSMVPMAPMDPIKPYPSETAPTIAVNYPPINSYPVAASNSTDQQRMINNYPVTAPYTATAGQQVMPTHPYQSAHNSTVTVYAQQQNIPIPQNYTPTYGRTDNYVPTPQGTPPYPPQSNMTHPSPQGNPLPIQTGQIQYPVQYPAPPQYPTQYPSAASYPPVYPQRTQDVSYGNGLPIPQAVAVQPPLNPVQNVAPQTYPAMYQQGNSPSPYRRLY